MKSNISQHLRNLPGWCTRRKIVVIESDDWGAVYMSTPDAFEALKKKGFDLNTHYLNNDTLESNDDMEMLFEVLRKHKDSTGRNVVITGLSVVANPDFEKIRANGFSKYEYELFTETCKRYAGSDRVNDLWKQGIDERLLVPAFHGREHLNVQRWMRLLQEGNESIHAAFDYGVSTLSKDLNGKRLPDLRAASDIDTIEDLVYLKEVFMTGLNDFAKLFGFRSKYFVPTNGPFNNSLEPLLSEWGVKYLGIGRIQIEPLGDNKYKKHFKSLGKKNKHGQIYISRNCFFEPNTWEYPRDKDWVGDCMKEIELAFRYRKPAIISSHRVNYMGTLHPENRENGLKKLDLLLSNIMKKWPDVEFMTSEELGDLIGGKF